MNRRSRASESKRWRRAALWGKALLGAAAGLGFSLPVSAQEVRVHVSGFRASEGELACRLFSSAEGFPGGENPTSRAISVPVRDQAATCVFEGLRPGRYAVAVFHDANGNHHLDTRIFGIPREGFGASRNHLRPFGAPRFEDNAFEVTEAAVQTLEVTLKYY